MAGVVMRTGPTETAPSLRVGCLVRMAKDYSDYGPSAVPFGREGVIVEIGPTGHIVVDFGHPFCERGCGSGQNLEPLP